MNILAFWTGKDPGSTWKRCSDHATGRQRDKWKTRSDYKKWTIDKAIAGCREVYTPRANTSSNLDRRLAKRARTDLGNGERLVARFGADVRFCHPWKKWLHFDGRRWKEDDKAAVRRIAKRTVRAILKEAATIDDDDERKAHKHSGTLARQGPSRRDVECASSETGYPDSAR